MEEKRKLEKLLLSDIDTAIAIYTSNRGVERKQVADRALSHAPSKAKTLHSQHINAHRELARTEKELEALGYRFSGYGLERKLDIGYGIVPKDVLAFDDQTLEAKSALLDLKRTYTLKLFAGDAEAQELFSALSKELKNIIV